MARCALLRRWLVEQNFLPIHHPGQRVTLRAARLLVRPCQRERGSLVVIEERWLPLGTVVARNATGNPILGELLPMDVLVAVFALRRRPFEVHVR